MFSLLDTSVSEITWDELMSPRDKNGNDTTSELGHSVFGRCQKRNYKGIPVAVKVFNNLSSAVDVSHKAAVRAICSHSSVAHIFGVNVTQKPYFLVSYYLRNPKFFLYFVPCPPQLFYVSFKVHCGKD